MLFERYKWVSVAVTAAVFAGLIIVFNEFNEPINPDGFKAKVTQTKRCNIATVAADCDDGNECTQDSCGSNKYCTNSQTWANSYSWNYAANINWVAQCNGGW